MERFATTVNDLAFNYCYKALYLRCFYKALSMSLKIESQKRHQTTKNISIKIKNKNATIKKAKKYFENRKNKCYFKKKTSTPKYILRNTRKKKRKKNQEKSRKINLKAKQIVIKTK